MKAKLGKATHILFSCKIFFLFSFCVSRLARENASPTYVFIPFCIASTGTKISQRRETIVLSRCPQHVWRRVQSACIYIYLFFTMNIYEFWYTPVQCVCAVVLSLDTVSEKFRHPPPPKALSSPQTLLFFNKHTRDASFISSTALAVVTESTHTHVKTCCFLVLFLPLKNTLIYADVF